MQAHADWLAHWLYDKCAPRSLTVPDYRDDLTNSLRQHALEDEIPMCAARLEELVDGIEETVCCWLKDDRDYRAQKEDEAWLSKAGVPGHNF